jgi:hypothetical protein
MQRYDERDYSRRRFEDDRSWSGRYEGSDRYGAQYGRSGQWGWGGPGRR